MNQLIRNKERISDKVVKVIEVQILEGSLKPGDQLPSERDLAADMGVSRPTIREAIKTLVTKGLLHTRHGGGTIVTDQLDSSFADSWQEMLFKHPNIQDDILDFREMLEGQAAYLAATRATDADLHNLEQAYIAVNKAYADGELIEMVGADVKFHQAVAEASHNVLIGHLSAILLKLINNHVTRNLKYLNARPKDRMHLEAQHLDIWSAIKNRSPEKALEVSREHIKYVKKSMKASAEEHERFQSAIRRRGGVE